VAALGESPGWARSARNRHGDEAFARRPGPERWSAAEVAAHLFDADVEVFEPRLERLLSESAPQFEPADLVSRRRGVSVPTETVAATLDRWEPIRKRLVKRLQGLGRDQWRLRGIHSILGPYSIADMVRSWAEHDLSHRLQMSRALGEA
jgi:hypothetical protein